MNSNDLLEQALVKLRIILQDADDIDTCVINNKKTEVFIKTTEIKNCITDIKNIYKQLRI